MANSSVPEHHDREPLTILGALWRYRWSSLLIVLAGIGVAVALTTQLETEPTATARFVLADPRQNVTMRQGVTSDTAFGRYAATRAAYTRSDEVLERAREDLADTGTRYTLGQLRSRIDVSSDGSGEITVAAIGPEAVEAARIANAVVAAYSAATVEEFEQQREAMMAAIEDAREQVLDRGRLARGDSPQARATTEALARLEARVADVLVDVETFRDGVVAVDSAISETVDTGTSAARYGVTGGLLGLLLALGVAFVRAEQIDERDAKRKTKKLKPLRAPRKPKVPQP